MKPDQSIAKTVTGSVGAILCATAMLVTASSVRASSHSDAPLIKQDPQANLTDVYAFIGTKYNDPGTRVLNVLVSVRPFSDPGDGVIFDRFADDALYSIHIANPTTGETVTRYDFQFSDVNPVAIPGLKNPDTALSYGFGTEVGPIVNIGDARQNFTQTYTLKKNGSAIASDLLTAPPNVGNRVTPAYNDSTTGKAISGATSIAELDSYTKQAIHDLPGGEVVFAGPRDDGFYADTPGIFDLLDPRIVDNNGSTSDGLGQDGGGVDGFKGFNVLSYGIQIPVSDLSPGTYTDPLFGPANPETGVGVGVGVYASVSRHRIRLLKTDGDPVNSGPWIQVNRMGNPLFNEVLVALKDKDKYNRTSPVDDPTSFASYAENPGVAALVNAVFGTSIKATGRTDLRTIFIPDVLRVNTTTDPVALPGQSLFRRFSAFEGDGACPAGHGTCGIFDPSHRAAGGWPNGRRIGDDVVDIALTAVARQTESGPPISQLGDNVAANDQIYNQVFPYLATPHAGTTTSQRQNP